MKRIYEQPTLEIIELFDKDILTFSKLGGLLPGDLEIDADEILGF